jgi:hypothetical protein
LSQEWLRVFRGSQGKITRRRIIKGRGGNVLRRRKNWGVKRGNGAIKKGGRKLTRSTRTKVTRTTRRKVTKTIRRINVRLFKLRSGWEQRNSFYLWMSNTAQGDGYNIQISATDHGDRGLFFYDPRTKTVRSWADKNRVLSAQQGWGAKQGGNLAMRPLTAQATADQIVTFPGRNIKAFDHCLTPHSFNVAEGNQVTWWPCQTEANQKLSQEWLRVF